MVFVNSLGCIIFDLKSNCTEKCFLYPHENHFINSILNLNIQTKIRQTDQVHIFFYLFRPFFARLQVIIITIIIGSGIQIFRTI